MMPEWFCCYENFSAWDLVQQMEKGRLQASADRMPLKDTAACAPERFSELLAAILTGAPVPPLLLARTGQNGFTVLHGTETIRALYLFARNRFTLHCPDREKWHGKSFEDLGETERFQLQDRNFCAQIVQSTKMPPAGGEADFDGTARLYRRLLECE